MSGCSYGPFRGRGAPPAAASAARRVIAVALLSGAVACSSPVGEGSLSVSPAPSAAALKTTASPSERRAWIQAVTLSPNLPTKDLTLVAAAVWQPQGQPGLTLVHRWHVNETEIADHTGPKLALADYRTGDRIHLVAEVRADDGRVLAGERSLSVVIQNRPPTVVSGLEDLTQTGEALTGRIVAADPDGEAVTVTLREGPPGLVVEPDGTVRWPLGRVTPGDHRLTIQVQDDRGLGYQGTIAFSVKAGA